jgi:AraC-like DNA-binding protein
MQRPAIADYPPAAQTPLRVIDDFEFVWMLRGRARFTADNDELLLSPGQLLLVPPGVRHGFVWDQKRASRHGYVHFEPAHPERWPTARVRLHRMTGDDPLAGLCAYLLWLSRSEHDGWRDQVDQTLEFMLALVVSGPLPHTEVPRALAPPLSAAIGYLREEWSGTPLRRIGVGELASAALVSRGYLNRLFRTGFDLGAASALEHVRFSRAETLLTRTDLTVDAIAHQCGFADLSHFSHRFTSIYGVPPSVYRAEGSQTPSVLEHSGVRRLTGLVWE